MLQTKDLNIEMRYVITGKWSLSFSGVMSALLSEDLITIVFYVCLLFSDYFFSLSLCLQSLKLYNSQQFLSLKPTSGMKSTH